MNEKRKIDSEKNEEFDVQKLISRFIDHWKLFLISFLVFITVGVLFILFVTPSYQISAQILVEDDQNSSSPLSFMGNSSSSQALGNLFGIKSNVYNELGILETRDLVDKVVRETNLNVTYFVKNTITSVEQYKNAPFKVIFIPSKDTVPDFTLDLRFPQNRKNVHFGVQSDEIDLSKKGAKFGDSIRTAYGVFVLTTTGFPFIGEDYFVTIISTEEAVENIIENLTSTLKDDNATIIALTLNSTVPKKGEDIMQNLIRAYIDRNLNEKNRISDSTLAFIKGRVDIVAKDLSDIEGSIQGFKEKNKIANIEEQSRALVTNASDYYNKLNEVDVQLNIVKTMLDGVTLDTKRPVPTLINADPNFVSLVQKYNSLITERDRLLLSTTEGNPLVQNIDAQLNAARVDMIKNLENQQNALQTTRNNLVDQNAQINTVLGNVPGQERQYIDLSRELDVKQSLYLFLLQQEESTAITKASNIPSASVIAIPKSAFKPYFPSKPLTLGISGILGLMFPIAFVILKYTLNNHIVSREDIKEKTECPIITEIGHNDSGNNILMEEDSRTVLAEQFRIFRSNMDFLTAQKDCPKILITSSMSGEGKSFIAVNLAKVYAFSGKKVLLIEMDLRKPKISSMLGLPNETGFSNYIISDSNQRIQQFIKSLPKSKKEHRDVFLLNSGPIPPNPAELLMSSKVDEMFAELSRIFDIIIIDSPPIGAVVDSQLLTRFSDVNLYVIRQQYSFKNSLNLINDIIENKKFPNLYLVVNDVKKGSSYKYGYGGYGYGYGYGYGNDKKTRKKARV